MAVMRDRIGGIGETREVDYEDLFEKDLAEALGERIRADIDFSVDVWSALTNTDWKHTSGLEVSYSFRAAGDLVAAIRGFGTYLDWYCMGPSCKVSPEISEAMRERGWTHEEIRLDVY